MTNKKTKLDDIVSQMEMIGSKNPLPSLPKKKPNTKLETIQAVTKQKDNLSKRLSAVGEDPEKIQDSRNILERALNLRPDQNFIFDIFEILKRPQQALFVGAKQQTTDDDFWGGFMEGLSGRERADFKDVLQTVYKSDLGDVEGKLDLIDLVGFAGDVFLDPANMPLFMVTGGSTLAGSVANAASATDDVASASITAASKIQGFLLGKGKTFATGLTPDDYISAILSKNSRKAMELEAASITKLTMQSMGSTFKGMSKFTDVALTESFKRLDQTQNLSKGYEGLKKGIEYATSETGKTVKRAFTIAHERFNTAMLRLKGVDDSLLKGLKRIAAVKHGINETDPKFQELFGRFDVDVMDLYEYKYVDNLLSPDALINNIAAPAPKSMGAKFLPYSKDTIDDLVAMFGEENILPFIKRESYKGIDAIRFDDKFFSVENNPELIDKLKSLAKAPRPLFDTDTLSAYTKTLRLKDPEMYQDYLTQVKQYDDEIIPRVNKLFERQFGVPYEGVKNQQAGWNKIKQQLMESDFKIGQHPQNTLVNSNLIGERSSVWLTTKERKAAKALLTPDQKAQYASDISYKKKALPKATMTKEAYEAEVEKILSDADNILRSYVEIPEDVAYTKSLVDAKNKGLIRMGRWEDDAIRARFDQLGKDQHVTEGARLFKESIRQAQRAVSWSEFKDETVLARFGFEGYTTHTMDRSVKAILEGLKVSDPEVAKAVEFAAFTPGLTRALASRQIYGSALGVNEFQKRFYETMFLDDAWVAKNFKETSGEVLDKVKNYLGNDMLSREATSSIYSFMDDTYRAINQNHKTTDVLLSLGIGKVGTKGSVFQNLSAREAVPVGFEKMTTTDVQNTIRALEANVKLQGESFVVKELIKDLRTSILEDGGRMPVMEKHIYRLLERSNAATPDKALKILDIINNGFKVGKTTSIGFNFKNVAGHITNQYLAGVPISQSFKYWSKSIKYAKQMEMIDDIVMTKGFKALTSEQQDLYRIYEEFLDSGFFSHASVYRLNDLDISTRWQDPKAASKAFTSFQDNPVTRANMGANLWVDNRARLSLYLYAKDNPQFLSQLGIDPSGANAAMNAVRLVHFDPSDLSFFEDDVMKRLVPFYTFARQNLAFQMKNLMKNSEKYNRIFAGFEAYNRQFAGMAPEDMQDYERNQFYVPIFKMQNGEFAVVKSSLTVAALTEIPLEPAGIFKEFLSKLSPVVRAPFELAAGVQMFTGQPIERYKGEQSTRLPLPYMTKSMEWLLTQTGIDVPLAGVTQAGKAIGQAVSGEDPTLAAFRASNIMGVMNPENKQLTNLYNQLDDLKARVNVLKSRGIELPSLQEVSQKTQGSKTSTQIDAMKKIADVVNKIKR